MRRWFVIATAGLVCLVAILLITARVVVHLIDPQWGSQVAPLLPPLRLDFSRSVNPASVGWTLPARDPRNPDRIDDTMFLGHRVATVVLPDGRSNTLEVGLVSLYAQHGRIHRMDMYQPPVDLATVYREAAHLAAEWHLPPRVPRPPDAKTLDQWFARRRVCPEFASDAREAWTGAVAQPQNGIAIGLMIRPSVGSTWTVMWFADWRDFKPPTTAPATTR